MIISDFVSKITRSFAKPDGTFADTFNPDKVTTALLNAEFELDYELTASDKPKITRIILELANAANTPQATAHGTLALTALSELIVPQLGLDLANLPGRVLGYTSDEVAQIQEAISGALDIPQLQNLDGEKIAEDLRENFPNFQQIGSLIPIYFQNRDLFSKVYWDPRLEKFNIFMFFPHVIAQDLESLKPSVVGRNRLVVEFSGSDETFFIKQRQTVSEQHIAALADRLEIGAAQLPTLGGFVTERRIPGYSFLKLPPEMKTEANMVEIGKNLAHVLMKLHNLGIAFNDTILADDYGHCHMMVDTDCTVRLVDFGNALLLEQFTGDPSDEFVINYARSRPQFSLSLGHNLDQTMAAVREHLGLESKDNILRYDLTLVEEGALFAQYRGYNYNLVEKLHESFNNNYR